MNELALKDIHLPDSSFWWPPAPGWWLLAVLLIVFVLLFPKLLRWLRYRPVKSLASKELNQIKQDYRQQSDDRRTLEAIASLLRRTVMSQHGRTGYAGLVGDAWIEELNQMSSTACFSADQGQLLMHGRYQPLVEADVDNLLQSCEHWIKSLLRSDARVAT
ncbi:MAG: hypothetical protein ACI9KN_001176 [Gammaproteobacteria bacterium]|jgi:hypothetical protein